MITNLTDKQKVNWVRTLAILPVLVLMIYAPNLWISTKDFPVIPLFSWLPIPKDPFDYILAISFFTVQIIYIFKPKRWLGITVVLFYVFLAFIDQNRLQPYFYQSFLTILTIVVFNKKSDKKKVVYAIMLIFFATYFWSGIQKLNDIFYIQWLSALNKHIHFIPQFFLKGFTYTVPWLEASMGVLLLFNKTRKLAVVSIVLMHSIITILLFYLGYGYNVVPWNVQNILSIIVLFWSFKTENPLEIFTKYFNKQKILILVFTILLPFSNFFGFYDNLLSFSFFTSKLNYYYIEISDELDEKLPENIQQYYRFLNGKTIIYCNEWAGDVNKVLFYPEERVIKFTDAYLRSFANNPDKKGLTKLVIYNQNLN
ncbi:HTTM domain-containing protein [Polaribacter sp. MSW13]|uniref:HTTM domain-containing protein n=1 Tax=Polaribacter marinus TaxID=2916838 RepID=A0A9X2ALY9_9FLAO|nr:HTTM domain-containing protein [Polaribacter marinus]MCI2228359.1 HTTM domain-containing protein [Polaribacter marinus]